MRTSVKKKLLQLASVALMFLGFVVGPAVFGFWVEMHPERSAGMPLFLVIVNLFVCALAIMAIADHWIALTKLERGEKGEPK